MSTAWPPKNAILLGGLGVVPFVVLGALVWFGHTDAAENAVDAICGYGAVILSFIGGAHWGFASRHLTDGTAPARRLLGLSIFPSLVGWAALLVPPLWSTAVLAIAFASVLALDQLAFSYSLTPDWWMTLRLPLSVTVFTLLSITFVGAGM
jgi:hypothetical protein